jgi:hypothetical protein
VRIAHIVPPYVASVVDKWLGDYHLLLPNLVSLVQYRDYYRNDVGFKIMDNGVAEQNRVSIMTQFQMARVLGCQEIVLPDVMGSMDATLREVAGAFYFAFEKRSSCQFMLVAQGRTVAECANCAESACNMFPGIINTFGVPRHILSTGADARVELVHMLKDMAPSKEIHLLGMHAEHTRELVEFGKRYRLAGVRGVDTSLAWNAAKLGITLDLGGLSRHPIIPRQPTRAFAGALPTAAEVNLLLANIRIMNSWV